MLKALPFAAFLLFMALLLGAAPARAQVIINVGRPAPPPVVVVREAHYPKKYKGHKHRYYRPQPVVVVPARRAYYAPAPVYYAPRGKGHGHGGGHGHGRH
ncbi:hypothetical protein KLP40_07275 [Hymenobacter sp. NST-14]|uniref:hypothetical protein n=1 Tax=Hymenobacter piscis TaxID=2839984 RepID=UPI001C02D43C|nr:hypothetical protein [Hymenobacter piscis]MBT9392958.1 hypothetical protein [Hymenobacter piscis]